jgi:L-ascorbate metabolism protein UlaG (beta-lactamase superfamily)
MCKIEYELPKMRKFDRLSVIGCILMVVSPFLPFWAGVSILNGVYDMWVGVPMKGLYGLTQMGPQTTVDVGWTTWVDVIMLSLGVISIFAAGIVGLFRNTVGGIFGVVGGLMTLLGFIGFPQIMYFWVWALIGPAFFLLLAGAASCLVSSRRQKIREILTPGKRVLILPITVILLVSLLIGSAHFQAIAMENSTNYFDENLNSFLPNGSEVESRRDFLLGLDLYIQARYKELPNFVEYSDAVGHGLGWGRNFQSWSLVRLGEARIRQVLREINETTVNSGAIIWRVYNDGFIVKTHNLTLGFDIACSFMFPEIVKIADYVDVLFVSHLHGDHCDLEVLKRAAALGVKIIVPESDLQTIAIPLQPYGSQLVPVNVEQTANVSGAQVRAFLGPHSVTNYVYLVELPNGLRLLHTGDTEHFGNLTWVDDLANEKQIDIAFIDTAALTNVPREAIKTPILAKRHEKLPLGRPFSETPLKPKIIVPMHENELGHGFAYISTWNLHLSYQQLDELNSSTTQVVVLAWGQRISLNSG